MANAAAIVSESNDAEGTMRPPAESKHQQQRNVDEVHHDQHQHAEALISGRADSDDQRRRERNRHDGGAAQDEIDCACMGAGQIADQSAHRRAGAE
jgi:hypothetical protein